jgi:serine/threonine protein kinase
MSSSIGPGTRIGPYEIVDVLGAGGMGVVYRATDRTLARQVALKFLSDELAADPTRLARFERAARVLASLNHPHIAAIYGFEESGPSSALVMELVDGPTLAERILRDRSRCPMCWPSRDRLRKRWSLRTSTASFIATSSRRTSSSPPTDRSRFSTSAWPRRSAPTPRPGCCRRRRR